MAKEMTDREILQIVENTINEVGLTNALAISNGILAAFLALYKDKMSEAEMNDFLQKSQKAARAMADEIGATPIANNE